MNNLIRTWKFLSSRRRLCPGELRMGNTYCVDKRSCSELSESINTMFRWYLNSFICYAYLKDVSDVSLQSPGDAEMQNVILRGALGRSRWFTRGWTLQELIAPMDVVFYSRIWSELGSKESLVDFISLITGIDEDILRCGIDKRQTYTGSEFLNLWWEKMISSKNVATRMSWFGDRQTTRPEDVAYSLLGIFGVQMPLLYGEGSLNAFHRLQEAIVKKWDDHSILAWTPSSRPGERGRFLGVCANHPSQFKNGADVNSLPSPGHLFSVADRGLQIRLQLLGRSSYEAWESRHCDAFWGILRCHGEDNFDGPIAIPYRFYKCKQERKSTSEILESVRRL